MPADRHILIDTYNLRLRRGSGIKTYGITLYEALRHLEARVSLLTDRESRRGKTDALTEVHFHDVPRPAGRIRRLAQHALRGTRSTLGFVSARRVSPGYVVPDPDDALPRDIEAMQNVGGVFGYANEKFRRFKRPLTVRINEPIDVFHATTPLPIRIPGAKHVTTIHDLIPLRVPYATLDDKTFFHNLVHRSIRDSDLILTISECTKRDIVEFYNVPESKIAVTYQALPTRSYRPDAMMSDRTMQRYGLTSQQYLLFVGNIEPKKNLATIIRAMTLLPKEVPLVVVGRKAWLWEEQLAVADRYLGADAASRLKLIGFVPDPVLGALYANAMCLVFPSLYEGFGLPPLEAMRYGCPVVTSNVSSLPEVCGDAALYSAPDDPDQIRRRIESLRDDEKLREQLVRAGYTRVEHFSAERYAERLREAYRILD